MKHTYVKLTIRKLVFIIPKCQPERSRDSGRVWTANLLLIVLMILLAISGCQKRDWDNLYDEKNSDITSWAPQNLTVKNESITKAKLSWECNADNISGFILDRKVGNQDWQMIYQEFSPEIKTWIDTNIIPDPGITYRYKLTSFAGNHFSSISDVEYSPAIPAPVDLQIEFLSLTELKLTWQDNSNGEEGFKIDRKTGSGSWEVGYAQVTSDTESFSDNDFPMDETVYYRVYSYFGSYQSDFIEQNINTQIPSPTDLVVEFISLTELKLTWQDNCNGEDGFKIDRKVGSGTWEVAYGQVNSNVSTFTDNDDFATGNYFYRVYAFYQVYNSSYSENSYNYLLCGDALTDPRDGKAYNTVQISEQCWMAENLNIGTRINGSENQTANSTIEKYCYGDNESNCNTYGGLYQWDEMMQYTTTAGTQGICPPGWHLPTDNEWCTLENYVDAGSVSCTETGWRGIDCGKNLKSTSGWNSGGNGLDTYGFTALPGGSRYYNGSFYDQGSSANFWSSSESYATGAWRRYLFYDLDGVFRNDYFNKDYGFSVRCLKD